MINTTRWMRGQATTIMDLKFSVVTHHRPQDLIAPGFVTLSDRFDAGKSLRAYERYAPGPEEGAADVDARHGTLTVRGDAPFFSLFKSDARQDAPFSSVVVDVASFAGTGGDQDAVFAGLVGDGSNYLMAWFSHASGAAGLDLNVDGELRTIAAVDTPDLRPGRVAFTLTGSVAAALVDDGEGFRPLVHAHLPGDVDQAALRDFHNGFGTRATSGAIVLSGVEAGYFGQTGLRDPHVVTHADGTPYTRFGKVFLTLTQAGMGFFETAHWGVWTLDLSNHEIEHVGSLYFRRDGSEAVVGDHAGHIVRDDDHDRWIVTTSTWGGPGDERVEIHCTTVPTSTDLLRGVHVLDTERLRVPVDDLPTEAVAQWDPHLVRIDDRWHLGFVNARGFLDFYPAMARGEPGGDFTSLTLAGADPTRQQTGGVVIQRLGGQWYALASNGDGSPAGTRGQYPVYDLAMRQVGTLDAPHPGSLPKPAAFPAPATRDRVRWLMVTFDDTSYHPDQLGHGTHGDLVVLAAKPLTRASR
jgi:hypothetical protein